MELEEYELAANLAEKYSDFTVLVQICDKTKDTKDDNRLMYYMDKYDRKVRRRVVGASYAARMRY